MFLQLVMKELKIQFKSVVVYLFLAILILCYITAFEPPKYNTIIEPLDEMHFMYKTLVSDYKSGTVMNEEIYDIYKQLGKLRPLTKEEKKIKQLTNIKLSEQQKDILKLVIEKMNPGGAAKNENIVKIKFRISYKDYLTELRKTDVSLGGMTPYGDKYRKSFIAGKNYYGATFGSIRLNEAEEIGTIYKMIKNDLIYGTSQVNKDGGAFTAFQLTAKQKAAVEIAMNKISSDKNPGSKNGQFGVTYSQYRGILQNLDKELGGNTCYSDKNREAFVYRDQTYSEAMITFKFILQKDQLTNAYARKFADIIGTAVGIFTVFLSAFVLTRDKRNRMTELIYSRQISSWKYVLSKFTAIASLVLLCCLIIATHATYEFTRLAHYNGYNIDLFAFYKYTFTWILPTILFSTAFGMFISMIFGNGLLAIPLQFLMFYTSLFPLYGDYRLFKYVIRFRQIGFYQDYINWYKDIFINRTFYVILSAGLVYLTSLVLSKRRVGWDDIFSRFNKNC